MKYVQGSLFGDLTSDYQPYILISLREAMHFKILNGSKLYEYRRTYVKSPTKVFVYVTGKIRAICAYAEFGEPIIGSIDEMITLNASETSPNPEGISAYFKDKKGCFAIPIGNYKMVEDISLDQLRVEFGKFYPPQSYIYLDKKPDLLNYLLDVKNRSINPRI